MIQLSKFVKQINEGLFSGANWKHDDEYDYALEVIDDILSTSASGEIEKGEEFDDKDIKEQRRKVKVSGFDKPLSALYFDIKKLRKLRSSLMKLSRGGELNPKTDDMDAESYLALNNCIAAGTAEGDALIAALTKGKKVNALWTKIDKEVYSGHEMTDESGPTKLLTCYMFNYGIDKYNEWKEYSNTELSVSAQKIAKKVVETLNNANNVFNGVKYSGSNYYALHIGSTGRKVRYDVKDDIDPIYPRLAGVYFGKRAAGNILTPKKEEVNEDEQTIDPKMRFGDIFDTQSKDKWNPADIILIQKKSNIEEIFNDLVTCVNGDALKNHLLNNLSNGIMIPILMDDDMGDYPHLIGHNIDKSLLKDTVHYINSVKLKLHAKEDTEKTSGNFILVGSQKKGKTIDDATKEKTEMTLNHDEDYKPSLAEIIIQTRGGELAIEAFLPNKRARGGKCINAVKKSLGISGNKYMMEFKDNNELFAELDKYFIIDAAKKKSLQEYDLYNRICYQGFFGLLYAFQKHYKDKNKKDISGVKLLVAFCDFIWDHCVNCNSSYYIIK